MLYHVLFRLAFACTLCSQVAFAGGAGVVRDALSGAPLPGARVSVQYSAIEEFADAHGRFYLPEAEAGDIIVAAYPGYFYASAQLASEGLTLNLEPVPTSTSPGQSFAGPDACSLCHATQYSEWVNSPMANAGKNTWVYDLYDGTGTNHGTDGWTYVEGSVLAAKNPASECSACHQPRAWLDEPFTPMLPLEDSSSAAVHGVDCESCHRVAGIDLQKPNTPGFFAGVVSFASTQAGPVQFGTLGDVTYDAPGMMRAAYQPDLTSGLCAACHQDKNDPDEDGDFEEDNGMISEPTYLEWLASPYGDPSSPGYASCTSCHMPATGAAYACDKLTAAPGRPAGDVRSHRIEGTTSTFLENAVDLSLDTHESSSGIEVVVRVDNRQTGHHVPTGVTIRNVILLVDAQTSDGTALALLEGERVHSLGGIGEPTQGYYAGLPGKLFAKVNHDERGESPVFFTEATGITFDTRIPAKGSDTTFYRFSKPSDPGRVAVRARLIYRRAWRDLVDTKRWVVDGHDRTLEDLEPPHYGHLMEEATEDVAIAGEYGGADGGHPPTSAARADDTRNNGSIGCGVTSNNANAAASAGLAALSAQLYLLAAVGRRRRTSAPAPLLATPPVTQQDQRPIEVGAASWRCLLTDHTH